MFFLQLNVWKLKKSCYGQYDESRKWFLAVKEQLLELGMKSLSGDEALFYYVKDGKLLGLCILHVDDFLIGGHSGFLRKIQINCKEDLALEKLRWRNLNSQD